MGNASCRELPEDQKPQQWDIDNMKSMRGKITIVTGANAGLGREVSLKLALKGAHVILACRSSERGLKAEKEINEELSSQPSSDKDEELNIGSVTFMQLDVSSLASVKQFVVEFRDKYERLDLLVNNAGVMGIAHSLTEDGIDRQWATNYFGHFALTCQLFDMLRRSKAARIVVVGSCMHRCSFFYNEDRPVKPKEKYFPLFVYEDSKLGCLIFMKELDHRLRAAGIKNVMVLSGHPGVAKTNVLSAPSGNNPWHVRAFWKVFKYVNPEQSVEMGALPILYAASEDTVQGGEFYGPDGLWHIRGYPTLENPDWKGTSESAGKKLWELSEELTHVKFTINGDSKLDADVGNEDEQSTKKEVAEPTKDTVVDKETEVADDKKEVDTTANPSTNAGVSKDKEKYNSGKTDSDDTSTGQSDQKAESAEQEMSRQDDETKEVSQHV